MNYSMVTSGKSPERVESWLRCEPIIARTATIHQPMAPAAYDCVKLVVVRDGSALLLSEFGQRFVTVGDVVVLNANVLCGSEPESHITTTTIYLDTDYVIDQVFWQHAWLLHDRLDAERFTNAVYSEPSQVLRLGEDRTGMLMPWLDELVARSIDGGFGSHFHRMQALWFSIADVVMPFLKVTQIRQSRGQRAHARPTLPRCRRFAPARDEAHQTRATLVSDIATNWTLDVLSARVNLSPKQLSRVFTETYGKTPLAYLTMMRVEEMAHLLRETHLTIDAAARQVGWASRSRANEAFQQCVGMTPSEYRRMHRAE
ncbi:TPA: helix-turn-helix transcriptional regulator [Salmonella enterica subsp. enterica serovar Typhimurium]|uniref:AraC family transcriptional regulator n=1 Tax=Salmonella enterica TaxID=28901 RepID=A0A721G6D2_SALER|nr:AraC family transcriptional regulator [Salmonella enterica]EDX2201267.1 helix-turn-helix transcriptional regulator [Salmonella enterica subsp. enterica serovar Saintpaul]EEZ5365288.1 helix-turn-helix transcriptional regulator [Escherichia coli]EJF5407475.1 helix-turn-helix transcriptional regulator [Salmonella enterica subsp. enterica serovar Heidelberg]HBQ1164256.1 helix-turn-helix transcriptional regulator [Klebsiella pneumoniae]HBZ6917036.1 helix-turn-helix transcriptional regulator [Sal